VSITIPTTWIFCEGPLGAVTVSSPVVALAKTGLPTSDEVNGKAENSATPISRTSTLLPAPIAELVAIPIHGVKVLLILALDLTTLPPVVLERARASPADIVSPDINLTMVPEKLFEDNAADSNFLRFFILTFFSRLEGAASISQKAKKSPF